MASVAESVERITQPRRQTAGGSLNIADCRVFFFQAEDGIRDLTVTGVQTCALPISMLSLNTGRTVVNETGLEGSFAVDLEWSPDQSVTDKPSLFTALQEQLGLTLESTQIGRASCRERV